MHTPVLQKEVVEYLNLQPNENVIDCTFGEGGHAMELARRILPRGKLLGIDWDEAAIRRFRVRNKKLKIKNIIVTCDNFAHLREVVKKYAFGEVHAILFDLGMSSWHLEESGRGFSFLRDEPLDMRYSQNLKCTCETLGAVPEGSRLTAKQILNGYSKEDIERILRQYGEERFAGRIAKAIVREREKAPIETTLQLVRIITAATPTWYHRRNIHPATRTFQALRIAVNDELSNLKKALPDAFELLTRGGRLAVISFHSLEDRIVKHFFRERANAKEASLLTKKPVTPTWQEKKENPRARSAKLRVLEKLSG